MCDKKNSVLFTDTECLVLSPEFKLPDEIQVLLRVLRENNMYNVNLKNIVPFFTNSTNTLSAAGPSNAAVSPTHRKSSCIDTSYYLDDPNMPKLEDITYSDDEDDVSEEADFNNLETTITVSPIPITRVHKNHLVSKIIGDLSSATKTKSMIRVAKDQATQTRSMERVAKDQGRLSQMFNDDFHACVFVCFLSQEEPKRVHQALKDPSWIEAMQDQLLQFKMQKNIDADAAFDVKENESEVHVSPSSGDKPKKYDDKTKREAKRNNHVDFSTGVRNLSDEFEDFSSNSTNKINAASTPVTAVGPNSTNSTNNFNAARTFNNVDLKTRYPDKVYKVVKALYGLHQALKAWKFGLTDGKSASTLLTLRSLYSRILMTNIADLSKHTTRYISPALTQKVFANMRRVVKGFSGVETPLFESMLAVRDVAEEAEVQVPAQGDDVQEPAAEEVATDVVPPTPTLPSSSSPVIPSSPPHQSPCLPQPQDAEGSSLLFQRVLDTCFDLALRVEDDVDNVFNQGRIIVDMDQDERIELVTNQEKDAEVEGRHADKQAEIYNIDLDHASKVLSMQEDDTEVQEAVEIVTTAKLMTEYIKRYHGMKKKPQTKSEARKNMIFYLKNTEGYKMDFFKGKKYDEILPIFQAKFDANMRFLFKSREEMEKEDEEIIKSINETPAQKAAKRRKLSEEAQEADDLRRRLEIIVVIDNKPKYKIIRADDTHQFYISFTTLLKNFDREDLETLWRIVGDRFSTSKPTNFLDEYLLLTLKIIFKEPDGQDAIWRNQKSVHGLALVKRWELLTSCGVHVITLLTIQLFLLVEKRYPLSRFTLEQLVNVTRLQLEEESEMSLELLRFTRQQL
nr:hypothetical protein [Tanacetum cinerariifolium]